MESKIFNTFSSTELEVLRRGLDPKTTLLFTFSSASIFENVAYFVLLPKSYALLLDEDDNLIHCGGAKTYLDS